MGGRFGKKTGRAGLPLFLALSGSLLTGVAVAECTGAPALQTNLRTHPTTENAVALGNWFANHHQFGCAVDVFRSALKADPDSAQLHYLEALGLLAAGHPGDAIPDLQEAIRLQPEVLKPHLLLADIYEKAGKTSEADKQWRTALRIDPHSELALEELSDALLAREDYIGVVELLKDAPRTEKLAINLSHGLGKLNYLEPAKQVLTEAMKLSPKSVALANAMSVVLVRQHRYQEAIDLLEEDVKNHPGNQEAEVLLFRVLVLNQHNDRARPMGPKLLAELPHNAEILYLNGLVERSMGKDAEAKAHLEEAVALDPDFFSYRYNLGAVLVALHEWKEAKENLEKAIALGDAEPQVHYELALALRGLGESDAARKEIEKYQDMKKVEEDGVEAAASVGQGDSDLAEGNVKEAIEHYRHATEVVPGNGYYKYKLSVALHRSGDLDGERAQLEAAVKLDPKLPAAQKQLGYLLSRSGDASGAVEHFQLAVQAAPGWTEAWINLAAELAVESHFDEARDAVATALRLEPDNSQARKLSDILAHNSAGQESHP
jgi:tetratricopeptide (TPR) repeat protein